MKIRDYLLFCFLTLFFLSSCGGGSTGDGAVTEGSSSGTIVFRLGNPSPQILAQIVSARVEILNPASRSNVLPPKSLVFGQEVVFSPVPVGTQLVRATGFDEAGNVIAADEALVSVTSGQASRARLVLIPQGQPEPNPDPDPNPDPNPDPDPDPPVGRTPLLYVDFSEVTSGGVAVLDGTTYQPISNSPIDLGSFPAEMTVDVPGERLFVVAQGRLEIYNARTLAPLRTINVPGDDPFGVAYDPVRDFVHVSDAAATQIFSFNATTGVSLGPNPSFDNSLFEIVYFEDRLYIGEGNGSNELNVLDAATRTPVPGSPFNVGRGSTDAKFLSLDPVGRRLFIGQPPNSAANSEITVFDIDTLTITTVIDTGSSDFITGVGYDSVQDRIVSSIGTEIRLFDGTTFGAAGSFQAGVNLFDAVFDSTQNRIVATHQNGRDITVLDASTLSQISGSPLPAGPGGSNMLNAELAVFPTTP